VTRSSSQTGIYRLLYIKAGHAEVRAALDTCDRESKVLRPFGRNLHSFRSDNETQPIITINVSTYWGDIVNAYPGVSGY
jgi:hypothetical protein